MTAQPTTQTDNEAAYHLFVDGARVTFHKQGKSTLAVVSYGLRKIIVSNAIELCEWITEVDAQENKAHFTPRGWEYGSSAEARQERLL